MADQIVPINYLQCLKDHMNLLKQAYGGWGCSVSWSYSREFGDSQLAPLTERKSDKASRKTKTYELNSLKGGYMGDYIGDYYRAYLGGY